MRFAPVGVLVVAGLSLLLSAGTASSTTAACLAGSLRPVGTEAVAYAGVAKRPLSVYRRPRVEAFANFGKLNQNGYPTTFAIVGAIMAKGCSAEWYRVQVPIRPNGTVGYVRARDIAIQKVTARIRIDLSERRLTLYDKGKKVLSTSVAVGSPATPTPVGRFYVNQRILTTDASGPFGPAALGVSAFSDVLTGWAQGGPIGIHGTNAPWSIGQAVSNGCIRLDNAVLTRVFRRVLAGAPVVISA